MQSAVRLSESLFCPTPTHHPTSYIFHSAVQTPIAGFECSPLEDLGKNMMGTKGYARLPVGGKDDLNAKDFVQEKKLPNTFTFYTLNVHAEECVFGKDALKQALS